MKKKLIPKKAEHRQVRFRRKQIRTRRTFGRCADCGKRSARYRCAGCREQQRERQRLLMRQRRGIVADSPEPLRRGRRK
jgi:recombinational DNA repair protein RecR